MLVGKYELVESRNAEMSQHLQVRLFCEPRAAGASAAVALLQVRGSDLNPPVHRQVLLEVEWNGMQGSDGAGVAQKRNYSTFAGRTPTIAILGRSNAVETKSTNIFAIAHIRTPGLG